MNLDSVQTAAPPVAQHRAVAVVEAAHRHGVRVVTERVVAAGGRGGGGEAGGEQLQQQRGPHHAALQQPRPLQSCSHAHSTAATTERWDTLETLDLIILLTSCHSADPQTRYFECLPLKHSF